MSGYEDQRVETRFDWGDPDKAAMNTEILAERLANVQANGEKDHAALSRRVGAIEDRIDVFEVHVNGRFDRLEEGLREDRQKADTKWMWMMGMIATVLLALGGLVFQVSQGA